MRPDRASKEHPRTPQAWALGWLGLSLAWLVVIIVTDVPAWTLAVWIAATLGPLAALQRRTRPTASLDVTGHSQGGSRR